ncbi:hypothetical protein IRJ34_03945 [Paenarthrobacter sp. GOM3]|uniref:DUF7793 family protein n=1 Tax=Paenarthrobacter sp. GOM3 TaxID=2782567 RepID=UPI001BA5C9F9|nr:hypothetical protein [Paenarthrobacter sp. GOM3]WOH19486.1 hypothetical protein IRJ34_03945 [Paenarthrobacter sp. GOM3]
MRPGIVRIVLRPHSRISELEGAWAREQLLALTGGDPVGVLLQITGVEWVSREAVAVCSRATTIAAFALLGSTAVDMVIAHSPRGLPRPGCPVKYFVDEQEALAWLAKYC